MGSFNRGGFSPSRTVVTDLEVDAGTVSVDVTNDRLGVGTTDPRTRLTVEGTITVKEQANADSDTAAYGQLWVKSNSPNDLYYTNDAGNDVRITNGTSLAAAASSSAVAADDITTGDAATSIATSSGNISIDSQAGSTTVDGHTGVNIVSSNSGEVDITSAAAIDINATTGITADGTTVSIDGTDDSNFTVTGSGKDLDIAVAGGSTQELRLASAGTGASALHLNASAGGINIDAADMLDIDAADEITIDTTSADGHIAITSAHTAGQSILISANADAGAILDIDAGIIDIDVQDTIDIDAADEITIDTTSADGHIAITSAHTAGQSILISANADAGAILDIDAGIIDIDVQDTINIDAADEIEIATTSADGHITLTSAHTAGVAFHLDANAHADSEVQIDAGILDIDVTAAATIDAVGIAIGAGSGELDLTTTGTLDVNANALDMDLTDSSTITITSSEAAEDLTIQQVGANDSSIIVTAAGNGSDAISVDATAGGIVIGASLIDGKELVLGNTSSTYLKLTPHGTAASEKVLLYNAAGTADDAIMIHADAGGITIKADDDSLHIDADGTDADALNIDSAGGIDIDAADMIDIDAADEITIDTTSADGHIAITSAHTAGQSILISANADAGSILDVDAGIIDIDVQDTINIDAADEIEIATTSADGHITLTSAHTAGVAFHLDANADADSEVQIDAGILDIDVTGNASIDSSAGSITIGAALADGQTLKLGKNGAVETIIAPHGTAGSEAYSVTNTAGTTDGAYGQGAMLFEATAGGIGLKWADGKDLWAEGGRTVITANEDAADCIKLHADDGTSQTITVVNDAGTSESAIALTSTAGGIDINAAAGKDVTIDGGQLLLTSAHDTASAIYLRANAGTSETIRIHADQGTAAGSVSIDSDAGGITISAGNTTHGVVVGNVSGAPVTIGHATSETIVSDNLNVDGNIAHGTGKKVIFQEVDVRHAHGTPDTVSIAVGPIIPRYSVITKVVAIVKTQSDLSGGHLVNLRVGAASQSADTDISGASFEILGAGSANTRSSDETGAAADIDLRNDTKEVWVNDSVQFAATAADGQVYVCNAVDNGGSDAGAGTLIIYIEYYGLD